MKKRRFTEEQIAFALCQAETGTAAAEVIRKMGIRERTFYRWKKQYAGMGVAELRRMKQLEEENRKLKALAIEVGQGITGEQVAGVSDAVIAVRQAPQRIRVDNALSSYPTPSTAGPRYSHL